MLYESLVMVCDVTSWVIYCVMSDDGSLREDEEENIMEE